MVVKDRLAEFKKARKNKKSKQESDLDEIEVLQKEIENVKSDIDQIESNLKLMKNLQTKILGSFYVNEKDKNYLESLKSQNLLLAKTVKKILKNEKLKLTENSSAYELKKNMIHGQLTRFTQIWENYLLDQSSYQERSKKIFAKAWKIKAGNQDLDFEDQQNLENDSFANVFASNYLMETEKSKQQLSQLNARLEEFKELEKQVTEVRDLFLEISILITEQGETIDRIETRIDDAEINVDKGNDQLKKAKKLKHKKRKLKIILASCGSTLAGLILLGIFI